MSDLRLWRTFLSFRGGPSITDASLSGWVAVFCSRTAQCPWSEEFLLQINLLEWRTIFLAPFHWSPLLQGHLVRDQTENTTASAYLTHQGAPGTLWLLKDPLTYQGPELNISILSAVNIPGAENWAVDFLSWEPWIQGTGPISQKWGMWTFSHPVSVTSFWCMFTELIILQWTHLSLCGEDLLFSAAS